MRKSIKIFLGTTGVLFIILGMLCLCFPVAALASMAWLLGFITLMAGIFQLIAVLNAQDLIPNSGTRVLSSVLQIVVGCILLGNTLIVTAGLPIIFALWVLVEGIITAVKSFDYKGAAYKYWWCILLLGVLGAVLGFCGLRNPLAAGATFSAFVGIGAISEGISYLVALGGIKRFEKKVRKGIEQIKGNLADQQ